MVRYGKHDDTDDKPTSMHIRRVARKYREHKLARGVGHNYDMRHRGGESVKPPEPQ